MAIPFDTVAGFGSETVFKFVCYLRGKGEQSQTITYHASLEEVYDFLGLHPVGDVSPVQLDCCDFSYSVHYEERLKDLNIAVASRGGLTEIFKTRNVDANALAAYFKANAIKKKAIRATWNSAVSNVGTSCDGIEAMDRGSNAVAMTTLSPLADAERRELDALRAYKAIMEGKNISAQKSDDRKAREDHIEQVGEKVGEYIAEVASEHVSGVVGGALEAFVPLGLGGFAKHAFKKSQEA